MGRYTIFANYDPTKPIGVLELSDEISEEIIMHWVIAPQIQISPEGYTIQSFGMFPKGSLNAEPSGVL